MTTLRTLKDLLIDQMQDVYDAEHQLIEALPAMLKAAKHSELREAFNNQLIQTRDHVDRVAQSFDKMGLPSTRKKCNAMVGLIKEAREVLECSGDPDVIDAALIAAAQRVKHYQIAAYGSIKAFAKRTDHGEVVALIDKNLDEVTAADKLLNKLAEGSLMHKSINKEAALAV